MAGGEVRTLVLTVAIITLLAVGLYLVDPTMCGLVKSTDGFTSSPSSTLSANSTGSTAGMGAVDATSTVGSEQLAALAGNPSAIDATLNTAAGMLQGRGKPGDPANQQNEAFANKAKFTNPKQEGFANLEDITGPAEFGSTPSANGCYPRDQLTPGELLPKDGNSTWAQQNPMGTGSLKGKNFLSAGALVGVNTVGQSLRNANQQLRSEPPNPQVPVSVFFNSTIEPDTNRRDMEIN
jgi:hypothetical protein